MRWLTILVFVWIASGARSVQAGSEGAGCLGMELADLTAEEAGVIHWPSARGAKITAVIPGGLAESAGLRSGDVLDAIDNARIWSKAQFEAAIASKPPEARVTIKIRRGDKVLWFSTPLGAGAVRECHRGL